MEVAGQSYLRLTVPKNPAATNLTFAVETTGTLTDWSTTHTLVEAESATRLVVRDTLATES